MNAAEETITPEAREKIVAASERMLGRLLLFHPDKITRKKPAAVNPVEPPKVVPIPTKPTVSLKAIRDLRPTMQLIIDVVAPFYERTDFDLYSRRMDLVTCRARNIAMWCARQFTYLSFAEIGRKVNHRDHSTAMNSVARIEAEIEDNARLADEIEVIKLHLFEALTNRSAA